MAIVQHKIEKKSVTVSDSTIATEGLGDFFKTLGRMGPNASKKKAKNVSKNPGGVLEIGANVGTAYASGSPKTPLSSVAEVISFYHTGKGLYIEKLV